MTKQFCLSGLYCFIFFFIALTITKVQADTNSPLKIMAVDHSTNDQLYDYIEVLEDAQLKLSIDSLLSGDYSGKFAKVTQAPPNYGLTKSAYWFRFKIKNGSDNILPLLLELQNPRMQNAQLYVVANNQVLSSETIGINQPFARRAIHYRNPVFKLLLTKNTEQTLYLRTETHTLHLVPLMLKSPLVFFEYKNNESYLFGIFIGTLFFVVGYNLIVYFSIRDKSYLFYICYVCGFLFYLTSMDGLTYQYLWPNNPEWGLIAPLILVILTLVSAFYFSMSFLDLKKEIPWLHGVLKKMAVLLIVMGALPLFSEYQFATKVISIVGWISILMLLLTGIIAYRNHIYMARFYIFSWSILLVAILITELRFWGISFAILYSGQIVKVGAIIEVFLLSAALGDRINNIRKNVIQAQEETIKLQKSFTLNLEHQVKERTEELQAANVQLKVLSTMDGLTKLYNRRYFDEIINLEWRRLRDLKQPYALILCDIDDFKMFNDTYGHQKGDSCIQFIAKILQMNIRHSGDIAARYGGEEFVIACPQCDLSEAYKIAERIRFEVFSACVPHSASRVERVVSLSIGVAVITPSESKFPSNLISLADKALYKSKKSGRNKVTCA